MDVSMVVLGVAGGMFATAMWAITARMITAIFGQEKD